MSNREIGVDELRHAIKATMKGLHQEINTLFFEMPKVPNMGRRTMRASSTLGVECARAQLRLKPLSSCDGAKRDPRRREKRGVIRVPHAPFSILPLSLRNSSARPPPPSAQRTFFGKPDSFKLSREDSKKIFFPPLYLPRRFLSYLVVRSKKQDMTNVTRKKTLFRLRCLSSYV